MIVTILDKEGKLVLYGTLYTLFSDSSGNIEYRLTRIHKPCGLEELGNLCKCESNE